MKKSYKITISLLIVFTITSSCFNDKTLKTFEPEFEELIVPFSNKHKVIFSFEEKNDTFIFYPVVEKLEKIRHLERGFYNLFFKSVEYELTKGSFHYNMLNNKKRFLSLSKTSSGRGTKAYLHFLELGFDEDNIKECLNKSEILFDRRSARDSFNIVNQDYCIRNFKFDKNIGIFEFTDCKGREWTRIK